MNITQQSQALLSSPLGAAVLLDISANHDTPLEYFARPEIAYYLAGTGIRLTDARHEDGIKNLVIHHARNLTKLAEAICLSPHFNWWWEPIDLNNQSSTSPEFPHDPIPDAPPIPCPETNLWRSPSPDQRPYKHLPTGEQTTSTFKSGTSCEITCFSLYAGDHVCAWPLTNWMTTFQQPVRVYEINHPSDWHYLCSTFPHQEPDGRLTPHWNTVAQHYDGIHLTFGGLLSCDQNLHEANGEWSYMTMWQSEITEWLNPIAATHQKLPDVQRGHNHHSIPSFPYVSNELRNAKALFRNPRHNLF